MNGKGIDFGIPFVLCSICWLVFLIQSSLKRTTRGIVHSPSFFLLYFPIIFCYSLAMKIIVGLVLLAIVGAIGEKIESTGVNKDIAVGLGFLCVIVPCVVIYVQRRLSIKSKIYKCVSEHYDTLCAKRDHSTYYDDYGNEITTGFAQELIYFVENVVFPGKELEMKQKMDYAQIVANMMDRVQKERPPEPDDIEETFNFLEEASPDPYEFEGNCKKILEKVGWTARTTPKSGDQGVDVIAKKDDVLIVVQCKFYTQPVGNKAVQEVVAGKTYYKAKYAVVVTNNTYTKSARQLAKSCGVVLLNVKQLKDIDKYLN